MNIIKIFTVSNPFTFLQQKTNLNPIKTYPKKEKKDFFNVIMSSEDTEILEFN